MRVADTSVAVTSAGVAGPGVVAEVQTSFEGPDVSLLAFRLRTIQQ
jgi:hypothetical protein